MLACMAVVPASRCSDVLQLQLVHICDRCGALLKHHLPPADVNKSHELTGREV